MLSITKNKVLLAFANNEELTIQQISYITRLSYYTVREIVENDPIYIVNKAQKPFRITVDEIAYAKLEIPRRIRAANEESVVSLMAKLKDGIEEFTGIVSSYLHNMQLAHEMSLRGEPLDKETLLGILRQMNLVRDYSLLMLTFDFYYRKDPRRNTPEEWAIWREREPE